MKKHDEGYVLAYVTVVLLIFCLVATTILTGAMRNLEQQQNANQKMKDQYAATGMVEQVLSQLDQKGNIAIDGKDYKRLAEDGETVTAQLSLTVDNAVLTLAAQSGEVTVRYAIKLTASKIVCNENVLTIEGLTDYRFTSNQPEPSTTGGGNE